MSNTIDSMYNLIKTASKVLVILATPDPDSIGSGIVLNRMLLSLGKDSHAICYASVATFRDFPYIDTVSCTDPFDIDLAIYDLILTVDAPGIHMITSAKNRDAFTFPDKEKVICIDHHDVYSSFTPNMFYYPDNSSTCEIIYEYFVEYFKYSLNKDEATLLYLGLAKDTGFFKWDVHERTFLTASNLFAAGADTAFATYILEYNRDKRFHDYLIYYLPKVQFYESAGLMALPIRKNDESILKDLGISYSNVGEFNELFQVIISRTYKDYPIAVILMEIGSDTLRGSLRGNGYLNNINLGKLARSLSSNGGGHFNAAGFSMKDKSLDDTIQIILDNISIMRSE